jgi:protein-tyrosine phosphatase
MQKYLIEGPWSGELAIIPRPRGSDWLEDEVRALKDEGFDVVVSFLTGDEAEELGLLREAEVIRGSGLEFWNFPIPDLGVPASRETATKFLEKLHQLLLAGKKIAIHCRGSIGRSGLVASSMLVMSGLDSSQAFSQVSAVRGFSAPETSEQRDWVIALSQEPAKSLA